jgi:hypothetical protein
MYDFAGCIAASEILPGIVFSFEHFDSAVLIHHLPAPEGDKPAVCGSVHSVAWVFNFVCHDAGFSQSYWVNAP